MTIRTPEIAAEAGRLCEAAKGLPQDKAAIAAMMAESFINGMDVQARLTADSLQQRPQA